MPALARCYPHSFTFYIAYAVGSILNSSAPDIKEARELAFKSAPAASIANWRSPVLFVHGDDDRNVPFQQTTDLVEKLRAQKVEFEELIFPDEIHDLLRWSDWVRAYRATAEFFDRKLVDSAGRN